MCRQLVHWFGDAVVGLDLLDARLHVTTEGLALLVGQGLRLRAEGVDRRLERGPEPRHTEGHRPARWSVGHRLAVRADLRIDRGVTQDQE